MATNVTTNSTGIERKEFCDMFVFTRKLHHHGWKDGSSLTLQRCLGSHKMPRLQHALQSAFPTHRLVVLLSGGTATR
jgi:hypothetical protein